MARGFIYGRSVFARLVRQKRKEDGAATEIQRVFRGSLVISWSHIRMNKVAAFVFLRQGHEIERCIIDSTQRSKDQAEGGPDDTICVRTISDWPLLQSFLDNAPKLLL